MNSTESCRSDGQHHEIECTHFLNHMAFSELPPPDYANIDFIGPPPDVTPIPVRDARHLNIWIAPAGADVPYAFSIGAVTFIGVLYIRGTSGVDTHTSGVIGGVLNCSYDLNRNRATFRCPGVGVKGIIVLDFQQKHCVAWTETLGTRCCGYRNIGKCEEWYSSRQVILASW
jgi:hypothetical protein